MSLYPAGFQYGTAKPAPKGPATTAGKKAAPTLTLTQQIAQMAGAPVDYSGSRRQAYADAKAQTASTVAGFHALQAEQLRQAHNQAQQMLAAGRAAAQFQSGLGDATAADYGQVAQQQQQLASGFTGQLRDDAQAEADATAAKIAAAGGSAPAANQAGSLANLLYGLSAVVPQNVLASQALGAIAAARAVPGQSLALGQQSAFGALGQGQQAASQYNADITKALTGQAGLASSLAHQYEQDARQAHQDQIGNLFHVGSLAQGDQRLADARTAASDRAAALAAYRNRPDVHFGTNGGIYQTDPRTGTVTVLQAPQIPPVYRNDAYGGVIAIDPTTGKQIGQVTPGKPDLPRTGTVTEGNSTYLVNMDTGARIRRIGDAPPSSVSSSIVGDSSTGRYTVSRDPKTGQTVYTPLPGRLGQPSGGRAGGGLSASGWTGLVSSASKQIGEWSTSTPNQLHWEGGKSVELKGTGKAAVPYAQALSQAVLLGPSTKRWTKKAKALVDAQYLPILNRDARQLAADASANGISPKEAWSQGRSEGIPDFILKKYLPSTGALDAIIANTGSLFSHG